MNLKISYKVALCTRKSHLFEKNPFKLLCFELVGIYIIDEIIQIRIVLIIQGFVNY